MNLSKRAERLFITAPFEDLWTQQCALEIARREQIFDNETRDEQRWFLSFVNLIIPLDYNT